MSEWAVRIPIEKAAAAAMLRLQTGIRVCAADEHLWLRGEQLSDELDIALRKLPGARRFMVAEDETLMPHSSRLPEGRLPMGDWEPIATWMNPVIQPPAIGGQIGARVSLRLQRTSDEQPPSVLVTSFERWSAYALSAPLVRLRPLRFAVAQDRRTMVRGSPLPPIAGRRFVERGGIAVACGCRLTPVDDPTTLRLLLKIEPADLALFDEVGTWERIAADNFVAAMRSNVRATVTSVRIENNVESRAVPAPGTPGQG